MKPPQADPDYSGTGPEISPEEVRSKVEGVLGGIDLCLDFHRPKRIKRPGRRGRGMAAASLDLIEAMRRIAFDIQPVTGRGIGYKLFVAKLITSMGNKDMKRVYRLLKEARERGMIEWEWIVDEGREIERTATWDDPADFVDQVAYRRDFWLQQPNRVLVASEKGTVRGVLKPILDKYAVGFHVCHGYTSATVLWALSNDSDRRPLHILYVGDRDPSGMDMSERDLPRRFREYGGDHITVRRLALTADQVTTLPSFPAAEKDKDTRHKWYVENYGDLCWELDAMDPNDLRDCVEQAIKELIEPVAWERCEVVNKAELESLKLGLGAWADPSPTREDDSAPW
jgi:hypothetical protein